ncbi:MAG: PAS domain S-box protein [Acidobacteria bacterium]|nr:PAS domain S-box protein [Acidobacteriota bacterium]
MVGLVSAGFGLAVLVGWHTHNLALIQVRPGFATLPYNAALGFLFCGAGLLAAAWSRSWATLACGCLTSLVGLLTMIEYVFAVDLGIDQLLMNAYLTLGPPYAGRMSPNSAVCLLLAGGALLLLGIREFAQRPVILGLLGSLIVAVGLVAFTGYLTGITTAYDWGYLRPMAVHAAAAFVVLGAGIGSYAWRAGGAEAAGVPERLPALVGVCAVSATLLLYQALAVQQREHVEGLIQFALGDVHNEIQARVESRLLALVRTARRWEFRGRMSRAEFEFEARQNLAHDAGYQAIAWIDASFHTRWAVGPEGSETAPSSDLRLEGRRRAALEAARAQRQMALSRAVDLASGGKGFLAFVPVFRAGGFDGWLVGVVRIQSLLDTVLHDRVAPRYLIEVLDGEEEIYRRPAGVLAARWGRESAVSVSGVTWRVQIVPQQDVIAEEHSRLPESALLVGLSMAFLLVRAVHLGQVARMRADALARQTGILTSILQSMSDGVIVADRQGRFLLFNAAGQRMMGLASAEISPSERPPQHGLFLPDGATRIPADELPLARSIRGEAVNDVEMVVRNPSVGEDRWINASGRPLLDQKGDRQGGVVVFSDITERKRSEKALAEQAGQLQNAVRQLEAFSYSISHDLRSPLATIKGFSRALLEDHGPRLHAEARGYLESINGNADRMGKLIDHLLAFAMLGRKPLAASTVDMNELARLVFEELRLAAPDRRVESDLRPLPPAHGDSALIHQVFANLLSNAFKFTRGREPARIEVGGRTSGAGENVYYVKDNGVGFDKQFAGKLFGVFQRLHTVDEFEGTGVGLAHVQRIIQRHGGRVWAESKLNEGATFHFTLPAGEQRA